MGREWREGTGGMAWKGRPVVDCLLHPHSCGPLRCRPRQEEGKNGIEQNEPRAGAEDGVESAAATPRRLGRTVATPTNGTENCRRKGRANERRKRPGGRKA